MKRKIAFLFGILLFIVLFSFIFYTSAAQINSTNYGIDTFTVSSGGQLTNSSNYKTDLLVSTIAGKSASSGYQTQLGFFYGTQGDIYGPIITIVSPGSNQVYNTTSISFNVTLNEVSSWCGYSLDEGGNVTMTKTIDTNFEITSILSEGNHNVTFYCNDTQSNVGSSSIRYFSVDLTNPLVTITFPTATNYDYIIANMTYTATDPHLNSCWYSTNSGANNITVTCDNIISLTASEGSNTWDVWADDVGGHVGHDSVTFVQDTTNPTISLVSPTEISGSILIQENIIVNVTASDSETGINNIDIYLFDSNKNLIDSATSSSTPFYHSFDNLAPGLYYFNATACDLLNHCASTETRNVTVPSIVSISLPINVVDFGNMTVGGNLVNLTGLHVQNDGNVYVDVEVYGDDLWSGSHSYPGDYYLYRIADAGKGNENNGVYNSSSALSWTQMSLTSAFAIFYFNWSSDKNLAAIQINVTAPLDEPAGLKSSLVQITAYES